MDDPPVMPSACRASVLRHYSWTEVTKSTKTNNTFARVQMKNNAYQDRDNEQKIKQARYVALHDKHIQSAILTLWKVRGERRLNVVEDGLAERLDVHAIDIGADDVRMRIEVHQIYNDATRDVNLLKALLDELLGERLIVPVKGDAAR